MSSSQQNNITAITGRASFDNKIAIQIVETKVQEIFDFMPGKQSIKLPFFSCVVVAGFPSPADDHIAKKLDLNKFLIKNSAATFFVRVTGDSMIGAGIHEGDILVVDRSITAVNGKIVIAAINGEFTVKRLLKKHNKIFLMPENPDYNPIELYEELDTVIWGVVTSVLHLV